MTAAHPLLRTEIVSIIERAASAHVGRRWVSHGFTDRNDRASHPCGIHHGQPFSVFAKLGTAADAREQFTAELRGLNLLASLANVATPDPITTGLIAAPAIGPPAEAPGERFSSKAQHARGGASAPDPGWLLLFEAIPERTGAARSGVDFRSMGHALAAVHSIRSQRLGLADDGYFGPIRLDNRPVPEDNWAAFYAERRVMPMLRLAADSGHLPAALVAGVERIVARLDSMSGPEPHPCLLHGDAQQNNFLAGPRGAVLIDPCPYFGHPELDLALIDGYEPVPKLLFDAYREVMPIDQEFASRRELWRLHAYLAGVAVEGGSSFGRHFLTRLDDAVTSLT